MIPNFPLNYLTLLTFNERFNMFMNHLGFIILLLIIITAFVVSLSSALDVFDSKMVGKIKKLQYLFSPIIGAVVIFIMLFLMSKNNFITFNSNVFYTLLIICLVGLLIYYVIISILIKNNSNKSNQMIYKTIYKPKEIFVKFLLYGEIICVVSIVLVPVIYIIGTALNPKYGISAKIFPSKISFDNFKTLFRDTNYLKWYWTTFKIALLTMITSVFVSTLTAYIFSRYKFKGKKWGLITLLVLQMFPSFMGLIALFTLYKQFGLIDHPLALVLIYAAGQIPYNTWLIKGYFSGISKSLDESARIDGANGFQIFFKILFPLAVPILTFVAVTQFMAPWMDYILASYLLINDENYTLAVGLYNFIDSKDAQNYTMFAAGSILIAIPIGTLYVSLQRYIIEGITAGANKG